MTTAFYERAGLNVATYDARVAVQEQDEKLAGDTDFYLRLARDTSGAVLELGCGTGRVGLALAREGIEVVGLDLSRAMLAVAEAKRSTLHREAAARVRLVHGDMTRFAVPERFGLAIAPFRAFMAITDPVGQRRALEAVRQHLRPRGRICLHLFDPRLDLIVPGDAPAPVPDPPPVRHPESGRRVRISVTNRRTDPLHQTLEETWLFHELGEDGTVVRAEEETLAMRWTYRRELHYLLELSGFRIEYEFSDFEGSPPAYGREMIVIARKH